MAVAALIAGGLMIRGTSFIEEIENNNLLLRFLKSCPTKRKPVQLLLFSLSLSLSISLCRTSLPMIPWMPYTTPPLSLSKGKFYVEIQTSMLHFQSADDTVLRS